MNIETMANKSLTVNNPMNLEKSTSHMSSDTQMEMERDEECNSDKILRSVITVDFHGGYSCLFLIIRILATLVMMRKDDNTNMDMNIVLCKILLT
uniref:Uncharacterized protein n=1 Tax=Vespula pensylvanica TaxID=30213 RepID=A0A834PBI9_VESPE|nr:hypothetical protein H0235_003232 [Vespula pensylvanica]